MTHQTDPVREAFEKWYGKGADTHKADAWVTWQAALDHPAAAAEPAEGDLPKRVWLNDMGTTQKLSFSPLDGAFELFEYVPAAPAVQPSTPIAAVQSPGSASAGTPNPEVRVTDAAAPMQVHSTVPQSGSAACAVASAECMRLAEKFNASLNGRYGQMTRKFRGQRRRTCAGWCGKSLSVAVFICLSTTIRPTPSSPRR